MITRARIATSLRLMAFSISTWLMAVSPGAAVTHQDGFGVGVIVGEPTGLCAKLWLSRSTAVDAAAAWSFVDEGALHLHADYIVHKFDLIRPSRGALPIYYGVGGRLERTPVDLFVELVPLLDLAPETEFRMNGSVGVRYFFR